MNKQVYQQILNSGLNYLSQEFSQNSYLGFDTIFPTIVVTESLNHLHTPASSQLSQQLSSQLVSLKTSKGSFNYWHPKSIKVKQEPYPDDLDDTFYAYSAIYNTHAQLITGKDLAHIAQILTLTEKLPGGPYNTWIIPPDQKNSQWIDFDLAVNANVGYFLSLLEIELPGIENFIEEHLLRQDFSSPYYKGSWPVIYFISRWYTGKYKELLLKTILTTKTTNSLELSLKIRSLTQLSPHEKQLPKLVISLINRQNSNGSWDTADFYYYVTQESNSDYIGCPAITTAFALEAIQSYQGVLVKRPKTSWLRTAHSRYKRVQTLVSLLPQTTRLPLSRHIDHIIRQDQQSKYLLSLSATLFSTSFNHSINPDLVEESDLLSFLGWSVYSLLDDVIDTETPVETAVIVQTLNRYLEGKIYRIAQILDKPEFLDYAHRVLNQVDAATYQEKMLMSFPPKTQTIRLKKYTRFPKPSEKSIAHVLAPIGVMMDLGYQLEGQEIQQLIQFFTHFLNAKQMNDDAHDWEDDLGLGILNSASIDLVKYSNGKINRGNALQNYQTFWYQVMPKFERKILQELSHAEKIIQQMTFIDTPDFLKRLLTPLKKATQEASHQRKITTEFLANYGKE